MTTPAPRSRATGGSERVAVACFLVLVLVLVVGAALRFGWLSDMEYKGDERWTFDRTQRIPGAEEWPLFGMPSSIGLLNPGLSVWVFVALAKVFAAHDPLALARVVVSCNLLAYVVLFVFVRVAFAPERRAPWSWGLALAAVNPVAVLYERKIWPPCIFPVFTALFLVGWIRRDRVWGAALWGLVGALLGQIQMSGFFFAAGFFAWELGFGRRRPGAPRTRWAAWAAGSALGACPLVPWIVYVAHARRDGPPFDPWAVLSLRVFRNWCIDGLGLGLEDYLGRDYAAFLQSDVPGAPSWARGVHPMPTLQGIALAIGAYVVLSTVIGVARAAIRRIAIRRTNVGAVPVRRVRDETAFTCAAAFLGFGLLVDGVVAIVYRHYLLVTFPLEWVSLAYLTLAYAPWPRRVLAGLCATQLGMTLLFLAFIHFNGGAPGGDYGVSYRAQSHDSR